MFFSASRGRAFEDLELGEVGDRARLARGQVLIEDDRVGAQLHGAHQDLLQLAAPDQEAGIRLGAALHDHVERVDPGRAAELAQLRDAGLRLRVAPDGDLDEEGARRARPGRAAAARPARELRLERGHELGDVQVQPVGRPRLQLQPQLAVRVVGQWMPDEHAARPAARVDSDRSDQIETEQGEVGQVVLGQGFTAQVGVDQAQTAEATGAPAQSADVGQHQLRCIADHDVLDAAPAIDEHADLSMKLGRDLAQVAGQLE